MKNPKLLLTALLIATSLITVAPSLTVSASSTTASSAKSSSLAVPVQWRTYTPGVRYPDASDPTRLQPVSVQLTFDCIRFWESKNHLVDGNGSQGWYQFTQGTWNSPLVHAAIPHLPSTPNAASGNQQSAVAVFYYERNGRFGVEWNAEANRCPGKF